MAKKIRLNPNPTFPALVKITVPGEDEPLPLRLIFRHKRSSEIDELLARRLSPQIAAELVAGLKACPSVMAQPTQFGEFMALFERHASHATDAVLCREVVAGWEDGPETDDGLPVPYSVEAFDALLDGYRQSPSEIFVQYVRHLHRSLLGN